MNHPDVIARPKDKVKFEVTESPWMPLDPSQVERYDKTITANSNNASAFLGCDALLQSMTIFSDGNIGACCGIGARLVPELIVSHVNEPAFLTKAIESIENDFLKLWIRYEGPVKILSWAAEKNPKITWEDMYAHRCQACLRIYKDPLVIQTIKEHYKEQIGQVICSAFMQEMAIPNAV